MTGMEKPKCKLCGERHWGACAHIMAELAGLPVPHVGDVVKTTHGLYRAVKVSEAISRFAPPGQCPHCDARRADNVKAVKKHRLRQRQERQ